MKKKLLKGFMLLALLINLNACKKDRWIDDETVAEVVFETLKQKSGGLAQEVDMQTFYVLNNSMLIPCGDSAIENRNFEYSSSQYSASADYVWNIKKVCQGSEEHLIWRADFIGNYSFPRMTGSWQGQRKWIATQLGVGTAFVKLEGTCSRAGNHKSELRNEQTFDSNVETVFTEVLVSKYDRRLYGGKATSVVTINSDSGKTYVYEVVTTISDVGTATMVINGTNTFEFNLY